MKRFCVLLTVIIFCFAGRLPANIDYIDGISGYTSSVPQRFRVTIAQLGDIRAVLGTQGKNICVSRDGSDVAIIYGGPTQDPDNCMEVKIAYSTDAGLTWTLYGPFSPELSRIYPAVDGSLDFDTHPENLWFSWQETPSGTGVSEIKVMNFAGSAMTLPSSSDIVAWFPCIAVNPENPQNIVVTAWSYGVGGNDYAYCWVSDDGGFTWSDTIPMCAIDSTGYAGHMRFGSGGYLLYTYGDVYDWHGTEIIYPYYSESTDGGYTWSAETPLPEVPLLDPVNSMFWWHEFDCDVINDELWIVHNDLNDINPDVAGMWLFYGTGNPGAWTWEIYNIKAIGGGIYWVADTFYAVYPSQYPSVACDSTGSLPAVYYKARYACGTLADTFANGAHICGIHYRLSTSGWELAQPVSELNNGEIVWADWNATEVAHHHVFPEGFIPIVSDVYSVWVHEAECNLYFERASDIWYFGVEEQVRDVTQNLYLQVWPTVVTDICFVTLDVRAAGEVKLAVYDVTGRRVEELHPDAVAAGRQTIDISVAHLSNGTYFVVLESNSQKQVAKFVVAR